MVIFFQNNRIPKTSKNTKKTENLAGCIFNVALKSQKSRKPCRVYFKKNKENPFLLHETLSRCCDCMLFLVNKLPDKSLQSHHHPRWGFMQDERKT